MAMAGLHKRKDPGPGPGAHDLPSTFGVKHPSSHVSMTGSFSMGTSVRQQSRPRSDRTGPGQYHPRDEAVHKRVPGYGFGGGRRMLSEPAKPHGKGHHVIEPVDTSRFRKGPQYGFSSTQRAFQIPGGSFADPDKDGSARTEEKLRAKLPGPGMYNPNDGFLSGNHRGPSFSARARTDPKGSKAYNPGPGQYQISGSPAPHFTFGNTPRMPNDTTKRPGPGTYDVVGTRTGEIPFAESSPKWTMTGKQSLDLEM